MSTKNETGVNLTQGRDKTFDDLVKKTNDYLKKEATRLVMVNNGSLKLFLKDLPDRKVPQVIEIRQHLNNSATVLLSLEAGDIVGVTRPHYYNMDEPVKFYASALYLECQEPGEVLQQVFSVENSRKPQNHIEKNYSSLDILSSQALISNHHFLNILFDNIVLTKQYSNEMLQITITDKKAVVDGVIADSMFFNSNVYQIKPEEKNLVCKPVFWRQEVVEDVIYVRHHYGKNEIQFYGGDKDDIHSFLQWIESEGNSKFFIHRFTGRNKADPTIRYRVCPILPMI